MGFDLTKHKNQRDQTIPVYDLVPEQKALNAYNPKIFVVTPTGGWLFSVRAGQREKQQGQKCKSNRIHRTGTFINAGRETERKMKNPVVREAAWRATSITSH